MKYDGIWMICMVIYRCSISILILLSIDIVEYQHGFKIIHVVYSEDKTC
jgi:hypothetical protein